MNVIEKNVSNTYVIKRSKFICFLYHVENVNEINSILENLRQEYKDATHVCYSYILTNKEKAYDDGEPSGTAGLPILEILKKKDLVNVLCVVVRYFGGIKLGAGGLIRAYSNSVVQTLALTKIIPYKKYITIYLETDYVNKKLLELICNDYEVINRVYDEKIIYTLKLEKDNLEKIKNRIKNTMIKLEIK